MSSWKRSRKPPAKSSPYIAGDDIKDAIKKIGRKHRSATNFLRALAAVGDESELAAIGAAIDMTQQALAEAFTVVRPGAWSSRPKRQSKAVIESARIRT